MISAIIVSFDYTDSDTESLQSSANDVNLITTLLEKDSIDYKILGSLNLKGKLLHWKRKIVNEINIINPTDLILYITGHGSRDGYILWGNSCEYKSINDIIGKYPIKKLWLILDMCYSHVILEKFFKETNIERENIFYLISTSEKCPVALSSPRGSIFTIDFFTKAFNSDKNIIDWFK